MITFKEYLNEIAIKGKVVKGDFSLDDVNLNDIIRLKTFLKNTLKGKLKVIKIENGEIQVKSEETPELNVWSIVKRDDDWYVGLRNKIISVERV